MRCSLAPLAPCASLARCLALLLASGLAACGPGDRPGADGADGADAGDGAGPDAAPGGGDAGPAGVTSVYAHTSSALYRIDPVTLVITQVGPFSFGATGADEITDIAIDQAGGMIGISFGAVYRIDPTTAVATRLSTGLTGGFNGLSYVPAAQLGRTGDDVLVGSRNTDGAVFEIDPMTGAATQVGDMGSYTSSGDLVSVEGFGTVLTADNGLGPDRLVMLAAQTFAASPVGTGTVGFDQVWGLAYWGNRVFGFTERGDFITIDPSTGTSTLVQANGPAWWGAAVTTVAPVVL